MIKTAGTASPPDWSSLPGIPYTFSFENVPQIDEHIRWMGKNTNLWIGLAALYVTTIFYIQREMRPRKPYNLRLPLALWNIGLTLFSLGTVLRLGPDLYHVIQKDGLFASFCDASSFQRDPRVKTWIWFFSLSKLVEFGDTFFIVLRKQPLIFLHWFHHVATFLYATYAIGNYCPAYARWFMTVNAAIHTVMYLYYALRALRFRFPRAVNVTITSIQILQMIAGFAINYQTLYHQKSGHHCDGHVSISYFGLAIYTSFFILFAQFFISSYLRPKTGTVKRD